MSNKTYRSTQLLSTIAAIDAHVDQINDALKEGASGQTIDMIMKRAYAVGIAQYVFRRVMEDTCPPYTVMIRMLATACSEESIRDLIAFAQARKEIPKLKERALAFQDLPN